MVLRYFLSRILNNPQVIDRLSDWYPIRRAAKLTAYAIQRSKIAANEALESEAGKKASSFQSKFTAEFQEGFKEISKKSEKK